MTKKKDLKIIPGTIIKVDKEKAEVLKTLCEVFNEMKNLAGVLMRQAAKNHDAAEKEFWNSINAIFPELQNWDLSITGDGEKIIVNRPLTIDEKETRDKRLKGSG